MSKTLSIRLDEETLHKLDMMAKATDRPRRWLMARAVCRMWSMGLGRCKPSTKRSRRLMADGR
jgi:hypothetical protein